MKLHSNFEKHLLTVIAAMVCLLGSCGVAKEVEKVELDFATNTIPDIFFKESAHKNPKDWLKIYMIPFKADHIKLPLNTEGITLDRLETFATSVKRCRIYEERGKACEYTLEGIFRRFQVTRFNSSSGVNMTDFFKNIVQNNVKVQGHPIDFGTVDWASSNCIVRLECELVLKLKRSADGEVVKVATGQFSRTTFVKNLAIDLAGVKFNHGHEKIVMKEDANGVSAFNPDSVDANYIQGRVIAVVLADAFSQIVLRMDEEMDEKVANRTEK
jgi:hypothetical protein